MSIKKLIEGHKAFKEHLFKLHEREFVQLLQRGQQPKALFIGCSDSRMCPNLIAQVEPGDLFYVRNVGNIVPPYGAGEMFVETAAAIEYAVCILNVTDIIICAHTDCGACASLHQDIQDPRLKNLKHWIEQNNKVKKLALLQAGESADRARLLRLTEQISLLCQVENLLTYPMIQEKINSDSLFIHAWYYHISTGEIEYYDSDQCQFIPLEEYALHS